MDGDPDQPTILVIFGASGDLTRRKLIPALYNLFRKDRLPGNFWIVGISRSAMEDAQFGDHLKSGVEDYSKGTFESEIWERFARKLRYFPGDLTDPKTYTVLQDRLRKLHPGPTHRLYYLATTPELFEDIVTQLGSAAMSSRKEGRCNLIVEKPFGRDLRSARTLNEAIQAAFHEDQVYRIDHYLGKETAQNILFFRFANTIFEPVWNRNYINHLQITVAEDVDVGRRAGYYDESGVLRDMFQSHLLQLFTLIAMEPPASFDADDLRNEKVKVLRAVRPIEVSDLVVAQYEGYCDAPDVQPDSKTATFAALKLYLDNWRWEGVPVYLRSGKALAEKRTEITVEFKAPPMQLFGEFDKACLTPNMLTLCIQPDEGVHLKFEIKQVDTTLQTRSVDMEFHYQEAYDGAVLPEAYERLLLDAIQGDASLFARDDEIEMAWKLIDPLTTDTEKPGYDELLSYPVGSMGPPETDSLLERDGRCWRSGCEHD